MREPAEARASALPWEVRAITAVPLPPLAAGTALAAVLSVVPIALALGLPTQNPAATSGSPEAGFPVPLPIWTGVLYSVLIAYALTAGRLASRAAARDLRATGALPGTERAAARDERTRLAVDPRVLARSRMAGGAGIVLGIAIMLSYLARIPGFGAAWLGEPAFWISPWSWGWLYPPLLFWILGRGIWLQVEGTRTTLYAAREQLPIDWLDRRPLEVFGRLALRGSLAWTLGLTIASFLLLPGGLDQPAVALAALGGVLAVAAASFVLPVRGVRRRLRAAKREELARTDEALRLLRDRRAGGVRAEPGVQADLLAWRAFVADAPEWPFDTSTWTRFGLYLLIPLASWIGGALVERALGAVLD